MLMKVLKMTDSYNYLRSKMRKQLYINSLHYEMLIDISNRRKPKKKPEQIIEDLIKNLYTKTK